MSVLKKIKDFALGKSRDLHDKAIFRELSLIAFFAWIGLGADGLSSSCYGPSESFLALGAHSYLSIFVALGTVFTIFIISASYSQIIELFPHGGGGYVVASKLLSPTMGMISGCALLIDYVLTITVSVASGADAIFSLLPIGCLPYKLIVAILILLGMILLNMRGVKESILPLVPIFIIFLVTHVFIIVYSVVTHMGNFSHVASSTSVEMGKSVSQLGLFGTIFLIFRAYSMGAGTYTGIEAVSNAVPILREPRVKTAKQTMRYMAISLAFVVMGLMLSYLFFDVKAVPGQTLNAVLFKNASSGWAFGSGYLFTIITLLSEAVLLCVAAQTGFLGSPRVLASMAMDRWFPTRFSTLSDRLVIKNGILISGGLAILMMVLSRGSVGFLIVLYSINVFITFVLSQSGMVRHWWNSRSSVKTWFRKLLVNGIGLVLTSLILISMFVFKFFEGGWITIVITGALVALAVGIRRHYVRISWLLSRLNGLVTAVETSPGAFTILDSSVAYKPGQEPDLEAKTAILLVNGYNGMGLHIVLNIMRLFGTAFKNFVFIQVGVMDAGNFKGVQEMENLEMDVKKGVGRYVEFMNKHGYFAEGISLIGVNVIDEVSSMAPKVSERYPNAVFFGGQLIFDSDGLISKLFHNYTVFALQKQLYRVGIPFVILPVRV